MYTTLNSNEDFNYHFTFPNYVLCGNGGGLSNFKGMTFEYAYILYKHVNIIVIEGKIKISQL